MMRLLPALAAAVVLVAHGVGHGLWVDRWQMSNEPWASCARLRDVPLDFGDWRGEELTMDARHQGVGEINGYLLRRYRHRVNGAAVSMLVVCGRPGPIAAHTPDVCYRGAGYEAIAPPAPCIIAGTEFRHADFHKPNALVPQRLRIIWSWNDRTAWSAPANPRLAFGSAPALYKLYVVRELASDAEPLDGDPAAGFARDLLPVLHKALFPTP